MAETDPEKNEEVERLFALVRDRYGGRLTAAQLEELRTGVDGIVQAVRSLRMVRLENSDEPFQPFIPYRADP
jgi:hypothetical protein